MNGSSRRRYAPGLGHQLLRKLAALGQLTFTTAEARAVALTLEISEGYLYQLLPALVESGWLIRLRRDLYALMGSPLGDFQVHPFAIATKLVTPSAISHLSALSFHGLTEQVPLVVTAFTPRKVVTPSMRPGVQRETSSKHAWEIDGVRYEYTTVVPKHFFGIEEVWVDRASRVPMTDRERTFLEGFASPQAFGGLGEVLGILDEHLPDLGLDKLIQYALRYGKASVAKRLGWALEELGESEEALAPLRELPVSGFRPLDPSLPRRGPCDRRWMVQNNLSECAA